MVINLVSTTSYSYNSNFTRDVSKSGQTAKTENSPAKAVRTNTTINCYNDDKVDYSYVDVDIAKGKLYNRNEVTKALNELLKENGVQIPNGTSVTFSINPYDHKLTVSGLEDKAMTSRIESVLNSGKNSKNLFAHIYFSSNGSDYVTSEQLQPDKCSKLTLFLEIKNNTGYDLRDCISKDGTFYTQDGVDVLKEYMKGSAISAEYRADVTSFYEPRLRQLAREGFGNSEDLILQIEYKDGYLYDIGQKNGYGPGQTQWIDDLVAKFGDELFVKPEKNNTIDSNLPQIQELLKENKIKLPDGLILTLSLNQHTNSFSILGTDDTDLILRLQMLLDGKPTKNLLYYLNQVQDRNHLDVFA